MACSVPYRPTVPLAGLGAQTVQGQRVVRIGPIAQQLHDWRRQGVTPAFALHQIMSYLAVQGHKQITPEIRDQLTIGLQKFPNVAGLGALGLSSTAGGSIKAASTAASIAPAAGSALGLGSAVAIGQTAVPIPVIGAVIGLVVGAALILGQRHVGKAEASWRNPAFYNSLATTAGRDYDEKQFSEAFKGMLDTGNNIVPGCGPDRHKNPDCLLGPMAAVIAQGYLSGAIPLTATTQQVFDTAVRPWLQSGAGGLVNWGTLANEPIQVSMMRAAADRYLAGEAMTRGDMPSYGNQGAHTPTLVQVLQPILQQAAAPVMTPTSGGGTVPQIPYTGPAQQVQTPYTGPQQQALPIMAQQITPTGTTSIGTPIVPPDQTAALMAQLQAQGQSQQQAIQAAMASLQAQGVPPQQAQADVSGALQQSAPPTTAGFGAGLPSWAMYGIAAIGLGFVFFRQGRGGRSKRYG